MDGMIKRVELRASQSAVETEVLKTLYAYEERVLRVRNNGRRVRAIRTWRMFDDHGIIPAIGIMMRTRKKHPGLIGLIEIGRQDLRFEALVLRHPESFSQEAVKLAKQRLDEAIRAHAIRETKPDDQSKKPDNRAYCT